MRWEGGAAVAGGGFMLFCVAAGSLLVIAAAVPVSVSMSVPMLASMGSGAGPVRRAGVSGSTVTASVSAPPAVVMSS